MVELIEEHMRITRMFGASLLLLGCAGSKPPQIELHEGKIVVASPKLDQAPEPVGGMAALQALVELPEEVVKQNKSATVIVEAKIDINGRVGGTKVAKSSGYKSIDAAAMLAVSRSQWKCGRKKGEPVAAIIQVPIYFNP